METRQNNNEFTRLSKNSRKHLIDGLLEMYASDLVDMASVYEKERKYRDKTKVLMIAHYIHLSGYERTPYIDWLLISELNDAIKKSKMDEYEVREMYLDIIKSNTTPSHVMTVSDSFYLLELALANRRDEIIHILKNFDAHTPRIRLRR